MDQNLINHHLISAICDCLKINYFAMDKNGLYISRNMSLTNIVGDIKQGSIVNEKAWQSCLEVMEKRERQVIQEKHQGRWYLSIKTPIIDNNEVKGVMGISIDITEQKKSEQLKAEFLRNMNHDIRTPLTGIYTMARMLYDDEADPEKHACLFDIVESSERLSALLSQVLEITTLGGHPVECKPHNILDVIKEVSGLMAAAINVKGLNLKIDCPDAMITSDRLRISRILLNLLSNAVKFTQHGYIRVSAEIEPRLKLTVEDSGIGIPSDQLQAIFDKFTKLKQSGESQTFTGAGIGLYVAKQFAHELGGDIFVESELGKGSKFTFAEL